jgi:mannose-6-phosphate isomerase-like protein (cupin superfamily)
VRILAHGEDTDGAVGVVEMIEMPAGDMPPLHVHHTADETFYILEGRVSFFLPGRQVELGPGDFAFGPRGVPHAYRVEEKARMHVTSTPAGFERFVAEVSALDEIDPATLTAVAAEHDIEILAPPGALP